MTSYKLVMPGDLNHYGFLFGGKMLMWVDEVAWMAVSGDYPGCNFVTVGMGEVTFHKSVHPQSVLRFETVRERIGRTSVTYRVEVFRRHIESRDETSVFTTDITFVRVGPEGDKLPVPQEDSAPPPSVPEPQLVGAVAPATAPFRPMRRAQQALSDDEIRDVLSAAPRGVLAVTGDGGRPYCVTLNPLYDGETGKLYFHGAKTGHKIDALRRDPRACFTVTDQGVHDPSRPPDWALTFRSVVVHGHVEFVDDPEQALDICRRLCRRFPMDEASIEKEIRSAGPAVLVFALVPDHVTGKRVHEA